MQNDPKDKHVLAAAVRANAAVIVIFNVKDFPATALEPFYVKAVTPDDFLCDQFDLNPLLVKSIATEIVEDMNNPSVTPSEYLAGLHKCMLPRFANLLESNGF